MSKYLCKLWSADRSKKKAFMCQASIALLITKAKDYSLTGNKLVLECDGTEIDDDETLQAFLEEKSTLIILDSWEAWNPASSITASTNCNSTTAQENLQASKQTVNDASSCLTISCEDIGATDLLPVPQSSPREESSKIDFQQNNCQQFQEEFFLYLTDDSNTNMSSERLTNMPTSSKRAPQAMCDSFNAFEIPWSKMSTEINKALEDKKHLGKLLNKFCNTIVDELRQKSEYIPMSVYRSIAQMAVQKYPESFVERDGQKNIMSHIPVSLITTMRNRNNFLNSSAKKGISSSNVPLKMKKNINTMSRSCVNWQPNSSECEEDYTSKKQFLITMFQKKSLQQSEEETVLQYMADCFAPQRKFFNNAQNIPTVGEILQNWPMIFHKKCLIQHFEKLMELDTSTFKFNFRASEAKLKAFFKIPETGNDEEIIKAISKHFKENHELLFSKFELGTTVEDIKKSKNILTPWISTLYTSISDDADPMSYIWVEGQITTIDVKYDIVDLILCLLCYYYIFNIEYPKDISQTCEFLMRFFFKFYPSQVRGRKKHINNLRKINTLISKLEKISET